MILDVKNYWFFLFKIIQGHASCVRVWAHIFMKFVINCHLMSFRIKFHKDLTIGCGDIQFFVTLYNFGNEKKMIFTSKIIAKNKQQISTFWDTFFNMFLLILGTLPFIERIQKDSGNLVKK